MKTVIHSPQIKKSKRLMEHDDSTIDESRLNPVEIIETSSENISDEEDTSTSQIYPGVDPSVVTQLKQQHSQLEQAYQTLQERYENLANNIDEIKQQAIEDGRSIGMADAKKEIETHVEERVAAGEAIIKQLKSQMLSDIYDKEEFCLEIIFASLCQLIGNGAGSKEQIRSILSMLMEKTLGMDNVTIYISPKDYEQLAGDAFASAQLICSDSLSTGGAILKTGKGSLEMKLDEQLEKLKNLLLSVHKKQD